MDQTIWMIAVVAFGVVFYGFAVYYSKNGDADDE